MWTITTSNDKLSEYRDNEGFLQELIDEAARSFGVTREQLFSKNRQHKIKYCRWMCWLIMAAVWSYTQMQCGLIFGKHDHTTVGNALDMLPFDLQNDEYLKVIFTSLLKTMQVDESAINDYVNKRAKNKGSVTPKSFQAKQRSVKRISLVPSRKAM